MLYGRTRMQRGYLTAGTELVPMAPDIHSALAVATEAGDIQQLQHVAAMATGLQSAAKARGLGIDAENTAAEVVIRAERAIGKVLIRMSEEGVRFPEAGGHRVRQQEEGMLSLADLGFESEADRKATQRWQLLAAVPEDEFEARFGTVRDSGARISKVDFYRLVKGKPERKPEAEQEMHGDTFTSTYAAFAKASKALVDDITQLPADEMLALATDIRTLVSAYNAERARR